MIVIFLTAWLAGASVDFINTLISHYTAVKLNTEWQKQFNDMGGWFYAIATILSLLWPILLPLTLFKLKKNKTKDD